MVGEVFVKYRYRVSDSKINFNSFFLVLRGFLIYWGFVVLEFDEFIFVGFCLFRVGII